MLTQISPVLFSSAQPKLLPPQYELPKYELKDFKYHLCSHHPKQGGSAHVQLKQGNDVQDEFIIYGKPVADNSPVLKALGDKYTEGQVAVSVPKHIFDSLPRHEH